MSSRSLARSLPLVAAALLAAAPALADVHPTDTCVSEKLQASALACRRVLETRAFGLVLPTPGGIGPRLDQTETALAAAWSEAEAESAAAGVSCADTTVTSAAMFDLLDTAAAELQTLALPAGRPSLVGRLNAYLRLRGAALACQGMLRAEGIHLVERGRDRDARRIAIENQVALHILRVLSRWAGATADVAQALEDRLVALVRDAIAAATVSPVVPQAWTKVVPDTQVAYQGKTLGPICSGGTPYWFYARRGTVNKLVVYYQGGGACWDYLTCGAVKTFDQSVTDSDNPANATNGFADYNNPNNPFKDWNAVFVPYCTGDVHWGDSTVTHAFVGNEVTIQHKGRVNAAVAEKWAREHFVHPEQVFVTGSSAGSYGAIMNGVYFKENVYPSTLFTILGDAGNGVIPQDFLVNEISKWNIQANLPAWIPALNRPVTELNAADLWSEAALFYPKDRFANYTTAFDGGNGGQTGFYQVMLNPGNIGVWQSWWQASCAWNTGMRALSLDTASRAPNYRYYIGTGSRHTMWGNAKVYSDTTGGVPKLVDWVGAMLTGSAAWTNVECTDCGLLLPGDPRAGGNPPPAPFSADGTRIVCPNVP
jgi:hypothetical protein